MQLLVFIFNSGFLDEVFKLDLLESHSIKIDLNKKLDPKQNTIQASNIDAKGFRKTRNENPHTLDIGITS